jgi:large subunit ribosomal protein L5e
MTGDRVFCAAESTELRGYGLSAGLTNYSSAYATGLLLARRLLKQVGLADMYQPNKEVNGEYFNVDDDVQDRRPFKALLDIGINATTTGAKVFGVMKGACDGGLNIPHKTKRFPGYTRAKVEVVTNKRGKATGEGEKSAAKLDASVLRDRIFGNHVFSYMTKLKKEDKQAYTRQFSQWDKCMTSNKVKTCEELYKKVHAAIIANPDRKKAAGNKKPTRKTVTAGKALVQQDSKGRKWLRHFRLTNEDRKLRVAARFQKFHELANQN